MISPTRVQWRVYFDNFVFAPSLRAAEFKLDLALRMRRDIVLAVFDAVMIDCLHVLEVVLLLLQYIDKEHWEKTEAFYHATRE